MSVESRQRRFDNDFASLLREGLSFRWPLLMVFSAFVWWAIFSAFFIWLLIAGSEQSMISAFLKMPLWLFTTPLLVALFVATAGSLVGLPVWLLHYATARRHLLARGAATVAAITSVPFSAVATTIVVQFVWFPQQEVIPAVFLVGGPLVVIGPLVAWALWRRRRGETREHVVVEGAPMPRQQDE